LGAETLVVRSGALGDVLLLRPAVAALRRRYARVRLMAPRSSGGVLVGPGPSEVDDLIDGESADVAALFTDDGPREGALPRRLGGVELAVVYSRSAALARNLERLVPRVLRQDPAPAEGAHAAAWLARPLAEVGMHAPAELPPMRATEAEAAEAGALLRELPSRFVAVHPGSGSPAKNWPPDRFGRLLDALVPAQPWLLVEGPADAEPAAALAGRHGAVVARGLPARVLGAVLAHAGLLVGHDSGVSHLAAAWGAPTLALFGPTDPVVWAPVGRRVTALRAPGSRMEALEVAAVVAAARRAQAHPPGRRRA